MSAVEVSTDGGDTWEEAELSPALEAEDVWRQWRFEWDARPGEHTVVVRMIDGDGNVQPRERTGPKPDGASGWVSKDVEV